MELKDKKIIIATHVYASGPAQDLRDFLLSKSTGQTMFIGHPLFFDKKLKGSGYEIYTGNKLTEEKYPQIKKIPSIISYFKDIFLTIFRAFFKQKKRDLFIGSDNLNAFSGIILKWLGKTKKTVYYVIDYNPHRFENKFLNKIYHRLDRFCVKHSDETWNLSPRMQTARKEYYGFDGGNQIVVPVGTWFDRIPRKTIDQINQHTLVFMGHIISKQGVQYVIKAIPQIIKQIPDFKFLVIGGGEYLGQLKALSSKLNLTEYVQFTGFIADHKDIETMLSECGLAIAMYDKYDEKHNLTFTYFADPSKIKQYLATGLPILLSDVSYNAQIIQDMEMGKIIDNNPDTIANNVIELMQNKTQLEKYRQNAINFAKENSREKIFTNNISRILGNK